MRAFWKSMAAAGFALMAGCVAADASSDAGKAGETAVAATEAVAEPGRIIEVKMVTDDRGNYFEPDRITARRGDVLRFVLVSGVHNVSFPTDRNPGLTELPPASEYLQLPGQTSDLRVDMPAGEYEFVCDPHAALGMIGVLIVE